MFSFKGILQGFSYNVKKVANSLTKTYSD